jgi:hypothetical protein
MLQFLLIQPSSHLQDAWLAMLTLQVPCPEQGTPALFAGHFSAHVDPMNPTSHLQRPCVSLPIFFMKHSPWPEQILPRDEGQVTWQVEPTNGSLQSQRVPSGSASLSLTH